MNSIPERIQRMRSSEDDRIEMKSEHIIMASADNSPYNANTLTFLLIIKLYANDIIVRIHIKIAFSSKVTMNGHGKIHMHST